MFVIVLFNPCCAFGRLPCHVARHQFTCSRVPQVARSGCCRDANAALIVVVLVLPQFPGHAFRIFIFPIHVVTLITQRHPDPAITLAFMAPKLTHGRTNSQKKAHRGVERSQRHEVTVAETLIDFPEQEVFEERIVRAMNAVELAENTMPYAATQPKNDSFGCLNFPHKSVASPSTCSGDCVICTGQYRTISAQKSTDLQYNAKISDEEAARYLQHSVGSVRDSYDHIKDLIQRYGDAIMKRWLKKSSTKRAALLRAATPGIHDSKWAEARYFSSSVHAGSLEHRSLLMLPYLSVELLSHEPAAFLSLLHHRSHHDLSAFVASDCDFQEDLFRDGGFKGVYNPHCVVTHGTRFGELVGWSETSNHQLDSLSYPRAQLFFATQTGLASFLLDTMRLVFEPTKDDIVQGCGKWNEAAVNSFRSTELHAPVSVYYNQIFGHPPVWSVDRISSTLKTRYDLADDEIELFQADPLFVRERLARLQSSVYYNALSDFDQVTYLVAHTVAPITKSYRTHWLFEHTEPLLQILREPQGPVSPGLTLPNRYRAAMRAIHFILSTYYNRLVHQLGQLVRQSGDFRQHMCRRRARPVSEVEASVVLRKDPLFWNVMELIRQNHPGSTGCFRPSFYLAFIDDILSTASRREKDRIDQVLLDHLSEMGAIDECISAIRLHRPYAGTPMSKAEYQEFTKGWAVPWGLENVETMLVALFEDLDQLEEPLQAFMALPLPSGKLNKETLERSRGLREGLRSYCAQFDQIEERMFKRSIPPSRVIALRQARAAVDELRFDCGVKGLQQLQYAIEAKEAATQAKKSVPVDKPGAQIAPVQTVWGDTSGASENLSLTPRPKTKTRQSQPSNKVEHSDEAGSPGVGDVTSTSRTRTIAVNSVSLALFKRMFTPSCCTKGTASVRWDDMVAAMVDAGMTVTQRGGSAVTFRDQADGLLSVTVHKPHPDPIINPIMLGSIGKKVRKWLAWDTETFVERKKETLMHSV